MRTIVNVHRLGSVASVCFRLAWVFPLGVFSVGIGVFLVGFFPEGVAVCFWYLRILHVELMVVYQIVLPQFVRTFYVDSDIRQDCRITFSVVLLAVIVRHNRDVSRFVFLFEFPI